MGVLTSIGAWCAAEFGRSGAEAPVVPSADWRFFMLDAAYLVLGFGFLALTVLYVVACDRL